MPEYSESYLLMNSLSSSLAGFICNVITNPLWVNKKIFKKSNNCKYLLFISYGIRWLEHESKQNSSLQKANISIQ